MSSSARLARTAAAFLCLCAGSAAAQSVKLNEPFTRSGVASSHSFAVSASGRWLVYAITGFSAPLVDELHAVRLDGSAPAVRLSPSAEHVLPPHLITPDDQRVVYTLSAAAQHTLASSPLDGSAPATILFQGAFVHDAQLSPDGSRVVFLAKVSATSVDEIFSAPVDGGAPTMKLNPTLTTGSELDDSEPFALSPDSRWLAYRVRNANGGRRVDVVPIDGSAPARTITDFGVEVQFGSPDVVLFRGSVGSVAGLYGASVHGGAIQLIARNARSFRPIPGGTSVVFLADQGCSCIGLFRVPIAGGPIVDLAGPMARGFGVDAGHGLTFDSGGTRVVYLADPEGDGITELYSVLLDASQLPIRLNHTLPTGDVPAYQVSPSSPFVAYWAFDGTTSTIRCVPVDRSSEPVVLRRGWYSLPALSSGGFRFAPDGQHVVFSEWVPPYDIFSVPIDGSATPVRLTPSFVPEGSVLHGDFDFSALGLVLYIAEAEQFTFEVYAAPVDASAPPAPRSADLPQMTVGDVTGFELGPDGREVAFEASGVSLDEGIYVTRTDGRGAAPRLVVGPHGAFRVHPDGQRLLYASEIPGDSSLYGVRVDGQEPAVRLGAFESEETHRPFQLTPDGARALFVASSFALSELRSVATDGSGTTVLARNLYSSDGVDIDPAGHMALFRTAGSTPRDLYAVPVDGSRPAVVLGPIQPRQSSSYALQFSPDGSRVAFNGDTRLFAARLATGAPAVPLPTRLAVSSLVFSADSSHVDYVDDFLMRKRDEIYTVAADGGAAHALVQVQDTADVSTMQLARNGSYLYYIADRDTDQIFELYRVAGTGGASTRLNGNLVAGGDVDRFLLTPTRVVYAADQDANDVRELYSVPRDGSAAPIRVSAPLVADGNVTDFWVESTGTLVVYLADAEQDEEFDLYAARTDGTGTAHRLHPRPVPGGDVVSVQLDPEHALVVFRGDLDEDDAIELYASNLNPLIRRAELR